VPRPYALLNDEPVTDETLDLLGARPAATRLTGLITASRAATPFTLAVDAGWGMGKSSLMRLVDVQLRRFPDVHTVWYNAWTSTGADALEGLIKSVLAQVDRNILRRWVRRLRGGGALTAFLRALTVVAAGPLGVSAMVDELWRRLSVDAGARNTMRDALRDLVGEWAQTPPGAPGRLLVVFVDDLDRCSEETFLAVCEAVKVYLDVPGLAFVIGCDRAAIGPGGLLRDLSPAGIAFVEKIFQTSYRIPAPSSADIKAYVRSCARQAGIHRLLDDRLVELLAYRAARNPRRVKRLVNGLLLEASLNPIWADVRPEAVIRTLLLQYLYPDFYRMMTVPPGLGDGDVVRDFRTYRAVRVHCLFGGTWPPELGRLDEVLRPYGVPPVAGPDDLERALGDLEQHLPTGFPALVNDPAFISLVDELVDLPQSDMVLRRLREGVDGPSAPLGYEPPRTDFGTDIRLYVPQADPYPPYRPQPADDPGPSAYTGTDPGVPPEYSPQNPAWPGADPRTRQPTSPYAAPAATGYGQPEVPVPSGYADVAPPRLGSARFGNLSGRDGPAPSLHARLGLAMQGYEAQRVRQELEARGVEALPIRSPAELLNLLARDRLPTVLAFSTDFDDRPDGGFEAVERLREEGYTGRVFVYTSRDTPAREARADSCGARLVSSPEELTAMLAYALAAESAAPSAPPPPPSAGPRP
jgi:hypothetical protein